jgi:hypothetical protein
MIFCTLVIWLTLELYIKNANLESKKPLISVKPISIGDRWYLEVTNNGEKGIFSAEVCIFDEEDSATDSKYEPLGSKYNALWGKTNTDKSEIMNGHSDTIQIASITYTDTEKYFVMKAYDSVQQSSYTVRRIEFEGFRDHVQQQIIQVIISSDPSLKVYVVSKSGTNLAFEIMDTL